MESSGAAPRRTPLGDRGGHDPETHHRHYGKWVDEAGLLEAVSRLKAEHAKPAFAAGA